MKRSEIGASALVVAVCLSVLWLPLRAGGQGRPVEVLNNDAVVQMLVGKVPKNLILTKIQSTQSSFDVTPSGLVGLNLSKVPEDVMIAMIGVAGSVESKEVLTNDGVVLMVTSRLPRDIILAKIQSTNTDFDLTAGGLVNLNQNKVPQYVMKLMMAPAPSPTLPATEEASTARPVEAVPQPKTTAGKAASTDRPASAAALTPKNCKPDFTGKDRITKASMYTWSQNVATTGLLSQALLDKANVSINVAIGRVGEETVVQLTLTKEEDPNKVARAVLETQYQVEKGTEFILGFKEGGNPLRFVATEATSNTQIKGALSPKITATVTLTAHLKDDEVRAMRDAIGNREFDAIRVAMVSQTIDKDMKGNGKKLTEKFACFFSFAGQSGWLN